MFLTRPDRFGFPGRDCEGDPREVPGYPFAGRRATRSWCARPQCSLCSEYCQMVEYLLEDQYLLRSKTGLNGDA